MMCSPYSPKNHWCSLSFGQVVRTLKSVNFIQALGGNSLWRRRSPASLTCQQYYRVSYVYITSILTIYTCNIYIIYNVYTQKKIGIYLTYTMYIPFKISGYTVQNSLIYMVYAWYMSCIYKKNTWDILGIYNVYPIHIFWIYSA